MTIAWYNGSQTVLLTDLLTMLRAELGAYLTQIATARGLTLPDPVDAAMYAGEYEVQTGVWPSIGLYFEGSAFTPMQSAETEVTRTLAATVLFAEGYVGASDPQTMYLAALAYCEAVAQCLEDKTAATLTARGVWRADRLSVHAEQSPNVRGREGTQGAWVIAGVAARMTIYQALERRD